MTSTAFKIEVPGDYFRRTAAREYADDAGLAVVREFAQNACDAGATSFTVNFVAAEGGLIVASDDGRGCDADTLRNKVLRPLESQKSEGAVGGFGKAKELLYFANESWSIRTRDCYVRGSFLNVEEFTEGLEPVEGFTATVKFPDTLRRRAAENASLFFHSSERPGVTWILNGQVVTPKVTRSKRATKDFGFAKAYLNRDNADTYLYLRTGGLLTGRRYCYHPSEVGQVVLELTGASIDLLTPARDNFKDFGHRQQVDGWLNNLVTDYRRELADEEGDEVLFVDDETLAVVGSPEEDEAEVAAPQEVVTPVVAHIPTGEAGIVGAAGSFEMNEVKVVADSKGGLTRPVTRYGFDFGLMPRIDGLTKTTVHTGNKKQAKAGMKWLKANPNAAARLLAAWATSVRVCAAASGLPIDAVGFTFADSALAEFVRSKGRFALLVNPLNFKIDAHDATEEIVDLTAHELAHEAVRGGHTEEWAIIEHAIRRKCRGPNVRGAIARALRSGELDGIAS